MPLIVDILLALFALFVLALGGLIAYCIIKAMRSGFGTRRTAPKTRAVARDQHDTAVHAPAVQFVRQLRVK